MIFHIAVCSPDPVLRGRVERQCLEYYARRADACIVEQLPGVDALLARDAEGTRYELYLVELTAGNAPAGLKAADTLRRHGARAPLAFFAHTPAHAYNAYRVDAMQYLLLPFRPEQFTALLDRATEPEYGPVIAVSTAAGLRALPFADSAVDLVLSLNGFHAFPDKEAAYREVFRVLKPRGTFCGCFYVAGEQKRTDRFVRHIYEKAGFFTPPYETTASLKKRLEKRYATVTLGTVKSMVWFVCRKGNQ